MIEKTSEALSEYWSLIKDLLPLIVITASLTFAVGMRYIRKSYLQHTWWQTIGNLLFSSVMAAMLAVCMVCLAELILPTVSVKIEMGIAIFVGLFGMKGIDTYLRRKFKLGVVDFLNPEDVPEWAKALQDTENASEDAEKKKKETSEIPGGENGKRKED